ncbi:ketoacyl-ACP synthase III family protein [Actinophytocola sediminis]
MPGGDLFIRSTGAWLPQLVDVESAIASGRFDAALREVIDIAAVAVSVDADAPEMAARAAVTALDRAGVRAAEVGLLTHACSVDQRHLAVGCYLQHAVGATDALAFEVRQGSSAAMAALEIAGNWLRANDSGTALITAGDRFAGPSFDRWRTAAGMILADAGAGAVLSADSGFARLVASAHRSAPQFEDAIRFEVMSADQTGSIDGLVAKRHLDERVGRGGLSQVLADNTRAVLTEVLDLAGVELTAIQHVVVPHMGRRTLELILFAPFGLPVPRSTWDYGRRIGHAGACDPLLGLNHLVESGALTPGEHVLVFAIGGGFTWEAAVFEIVDRPPGAVTS